MRSILSTLFIPYLALALSLAPLALMTHGINGEVMPYLALCVLYFCALHHQIALWQIFLYGIFISEAYDTPLGIDVLLFVVLYILIVKYKTIFLSKQPLSVFVGFVCVTTTFNAAQYAMISKYYGYPFDIAPILMRILTTILFYPVVQLAMKRILSIRCSVIK